MKKKMWSQVTRIVIGLALLFIAAVAVQPAWATLPTPEPAHSCGAGQHLCKSVSELRP